MLNKIVLAGGSGYLGRVLAKYYKSKAGEIVILSRSCTGSKQANGRTVVWDAVHRGDWENELNGADLVINLCGKNVNCHYTSEAREEILRSRLEPTALLGRAIRELTAPPKLWITLASATIYRHAEDRPQDEETGEIGSGFSVDVCTAWEKTFWEAETPNTRKLVLRAGLVLGGADGVFPRLKNLVLTGLGGHQGTGSQMVSWIHEHDFARITQWAYEKEKDKTVYNCAAPEAVTNHELMKLIRKTYGIPFGLPSPQWLLEIGARLIGTETELVLKSRWVYPGRLLEEGFNFIFPRAEHAIHEITSSRE
jgi:uncharacterized protein